MSLDIDKMIGVDGNGDEELLLGVPNIDLFSHALSYADKLGMQRMVGELLRMAWLIPLDNRNWRYYQFVGDIYQHRNDKSSFDAVVDEFEARIDLNERPIAMRLSWHLDRHDYDQASKVGKTWLRKKTNRGSAVPLKLAQSALDATDYDFVLELTSRALEGSAESQPGASIAALLFYRANAYDSLFCREAAAQSINCERLIEYYRKAQRLYSSEIVTSLTHQKKPASDRLKAMRLLLEETGCTPIEEADDRAVDGQPNGDDDGETDVAENQLLASLNNGISTFLNDGDTETAVRDFLENSDPLQRLGLTHLRRFMAEDDTPPEIAAAARKFHDAILAARGD